MSLQLAIPRRVALHQSPPPLHQPSTILKEKRKFEKVKSLNGKCGNSKLSQRRGSPHQRVLEVCQGNRLRAAQILGIGRTSLYRYLKCDGHEMRTRERSGGAAA